MAFDQPPDSDNETPDWLEGLQPEGGSAEHKSDPSDTFSWGEEQEEPEAAPAGSEGEVPQWLANIRAQEHPETEDDDLLPPTSGLSSENKADTENWLEKIRVQYARDTGQLVMPEEESPDSQTGNYLDRVQALKDQDQGKAAEPQKDQWLDDMIADDVKEPDADDSGWGMSVDRSTAAETPAGIWDPEAIGTEAEAETDQGPDWLSGLPSIDTDNLPDEEGAVKPASRGGDIPEWLRGMEPDTDSELEAVPGFAATPDEQDSPDWLGSFAGGSEAAAADAVDEQFPESVEKPGEQGMPNWLENLKFSPDDTKREGKVDAILPEFSEEDVSALLFEADDLPDWLSKDAPTAQEVAAAAAPEPPPPLPSAEPEGEGDIAPAELPSWLQAMRPIETAAPVISEEEKEVEVREPGVKEDAGPLAGLSDVLPAEPDIIHFGTRSVPVTGFQISTAQKNYAKMLKSMVEEETGAPPVIRRQVALPQQFLRWVIAVLIMLVVFAGVWINAAGFDLPIDYAMPNSVIPVEERAVIPLMEGLDQNSQVLLAFDYQPGYSGEIEAAAEAVLHHLFLRGAKVSIISTQATGPDIAARFLQTKLSITQGQYTDLGYLTGGAAGLANFAAAPTAAVANSPVQDIRQYAMVLVITDDPDLARTWIEQVQTRLDPNQNGTGTPLVMVLSAQAEPLIYPFFQSNPKQVSGIVAGVVGGAIYEHQVTGISGTAEGYWFTYNLTMQIAVVLIAGISLINLFGAMFRGLRKTTKRGNA